MLPTPYPLWVSYLSVAVGGAAGSVLRYAVSLQASQALVAGGLHASPWAILGVNMLGCALMGIALVALHHPSVGGRLPSWFPPLVMVGFLGGLTTFSSFAVDVNGLFQQLPWGVALAATAGLVAAALLAFAGGSLLATALLR